MSFLTVEDVNSTLIKYRDVNIFHMIDTSNISLDEFENIKYDFCNINHSIDGNNHIFEFTIVNSNWTGAYYFLDENNNYLNVNASLDNNVLTLTTTHESVKLILYCCSLADSFNFVRLTWRPISLRSLVTSPFERISEEIPVISLNGASLNGEYYTICSHLDSVQTISEIDEYFGLNDDERNTILQFASPNSNMNTVEYNNNIFYYDVFIQKSVPEIEINDDLTVGKINRVELIVPEEFTKTNRYIPNNKFPYLKGYVYYGDETIPLKFDSTNKKYYFELLL